MDEKPRRSGVRYADRVGPLAEDTRGAANGRVDPSDMVLGLRNYFKAEKMRRSQVESDELKAPQRQGWVVWWSLRCPVARKAQRQNDPSAPLAAKRSQIDTDIAIAVWGCPQAMVQYETVGFKDKSVNKVRDVNFRFECVRSRHQVDQQGRAFVTVGPPPWAGWGRLDRAPISGEIDRSVHCSVGRIR